MFGWLCNFDKKNNFRKSVTHHMVRYYRMIFYGCVMEAIVVVAKIDFDESY